MTAMQLNAKKLEVIEMIFGIGDEKTLTQIASLIRKSKDRTPERIPGLAYTREERIASIRSAEEDIAAGRVISHEEMGKWISELQ